ncbi:MAG: hypothetical protein ACTSRA_03560, partial [Promethearchaeota archaeon]
MAPRFNVDPTARCILDDADKDVVLDVDHGRTRDIDTIRDVLFPPPPEETPIFSGVGFSFALITSVGISMLLMMVSFIRH